MLRGSRKETKCKLAFTQGLAKNTSRCAVQRHVLEISHGTAGGQDTALVLFGNKDHLIMHERLGGLAKPALSKKMWLPVCFPNLLGQTKTTQSRKLPFGNGRKGTWGLEEEVWDLLSSLQILMCDGNPLLNKYLLNVPRYGRAADTKGDERWMRHCFRPQGTYRGCLQLALLYFLRPDTMVSKRKEQYQIYWSCT